MRVCFEAEAVGFTWFFEATMSLVFIADVTFAFRTAYFDNERTVWVVDGKQLTLTIPHPARTLRIPCAYLCPPSAHPTPALH